LVWGLLFAEIGWLAYHWTFAYTLPGIGSIKLSQVALITLAISFLAERAYSSYERHGSVRSNDILMPTLLSVSVIVILVTFFSRLGTGSL
jgi:hypothetical protein